MKLRKPSQQVQLTHYGNQKLALQFAMPIEQEIKKFPLLRSASLTAGFPQMKTERKMGRVWVAINLSPIAAVESVKF